MDTAPPRREALVQKAAPRWWAVLAALTAGLAGMAAAVLPSEGVGFISHDQWRHHRYAVLGRALLLGSFSLLAAHASLWCVSPPY